MPALITMPKLGANAIVSALPFALKKSYEDMQYKVYITDCAWSVVMALTRANDRPPRYIEIIQPEKEETRTAEEIIEQIGNKLQEVGEK